jgi:hypothetical protein
MSHPFSSPDIAMLGSAIAAYSEVWENSGSIDAGNVAQVRERAMLAALIAASAAQDTGLRTSCKTLIDYAEWQVREGHYHPTLISAIGQAKDALAGRTVDAGVPGDDFDPSSSLLAQTIMGAARVHTHDHLSAFAITKTAMRWIEAARKSGIDILPPNDLRKDRS